MINGGFQNWLHLTTGLPGGWVYPVTDTSDILSKAKRRKRKTEEELLEEYLAAQIVAGRQQKALEAKRIAEEAVAKEQYQAQAQEKAKRIRIIMMFLMTED